MTEQALRPRQHHSSLPGLLQTGRLLGLHLHLGEQLAGAVLTASHRSTPGSGGSGGQPDLPRLLLLLCTGLKPSASSSAGCCASGAAVACGAAA